MLNTQELLGELQEMRDGGFLSDALMRHSVRSIEASDERYNWVGIYLLNGEKSELWLHNYMGEPTDHARIPVGSGICGTAVAEGANLIVDDVSTVENYLACDPLVESEIVVLIRAGDDIFGQIDIDSHEKGAFTPEDEATLQIIADKLAEQLAAERR